jgi:hypothetical protein
MDGAHCAQSMSDKIPTKAELEAAAIADETLLDRIVDEAGRAVEEAVRDHKRAGNPIAEWRDGRVVLVPPEQIED